MAGSIICAPTVQVLSSGKTAGRRHILKPLTGNAGVSLGRCPRASSAAFLGCGSVGESRRPQALAPARSARGQRSSSARYPGQAGKKTWPGLLARHDRLLSSNNGTTVKGAASAPPTTSAGCAVQLAPRHPCSQDTQALVVAHAVAPVGSRVPGDSPKTLRCAPLSGPGAEGDDDRGPATRAGDRGGASRGRKGRVAPVW